MILRATLTFLNSINVPIWQRVGAVRGSLFQDIRGEHSGSSGVIGLEELDNISDAEWHPSFDQITFLS